MKQFDDWSLRRKLMLSMWVVVSLVTLLMLVSLVLNLRLLRRHAIPDQRAILGLSGLTFDYLSEIREYLVSFDRETLEEIEEIEQRLQDYLAEHRALISQDPGQNATAATIDLGLQRLTELGQGIIRLEDQIRRGLEATVTAETELDRLAADTPIQTSLILRCRQLLSRVRQYAFDPKVDAARQMVELETELKEADLAWPASQRAQVDRLLETCRRMIALRQELDQLLEGIEGAEQDISGALRIADRAAQAQVTEASRALFWSLLWTGLVGLLLASVLALTIARRISLPLERLQAASRQLAAGHLAARSPVEADDEVGRLSSDFNHLAAEIEGLVSELRQAKELTESIVVSVPTILVTIGSHGRITSTNPAFERRWGEGQTTPGTRLSRWIDCPDLEKAVESVRLGGQDRHDIHVRQRPESGDGEAVFLGSVVGLRSNGSEAGERPKDVQTLVVLEDITRSARLMQQLEQRLVDLESAQAQLVQSGKMAAVGELAAGVAHELNNPLSVVLTYSVLLQEKLERVSAEARDQLAGFPDRLRRMRTASERCKTIVDNLLQFSRQDDSELSSIDIPDLLSQTFDLIGSQLRRHGIELDLEIEDRLPSLRGNASQLQQVLTNLAINAQQAMVEGGKLRIVVGRHGELCEITVSDNGPGIPDDLLPRIFEPFFTTKPVGQGTGLGLAITYGIVQNHGGQIHVDSVPGLGTTFQIRLPFAAGQESSR